MSRESEEAERKIRHSLLPKPEPPDSMDYAMPVIVFICISVLVFTTGFIFGVQRRRSLIDNIKTIQKEAVERKHAEFVSLEDGVQAFRWLD